MQDVVTLDGPAGSGKSSVARAVARALGWRFLDTGAMYRAFTLHLLAQDLDPASEAACREGLATLRLEVDAGGGLLLAGRPVADPELRTPPVEAGVSLVAACSPVREHMRELQRAVGRQGRVVAEGRDMGSVVFPGATYKFFLDASPECRARRRQQDFSAGGRAVELDRVLAELDRRDRADRERQDGPLVRPADATVIDTTALTFGEVVERILTAVTGGERS